VNDNSGSRNDILNPSSVGCGPLVRIALALRDSSAACVVVMMAVALLQEVRCLFARHWVPRGAPRFNSLQEPVADVVVGFLHLELRLGRGLSLPAEV
jgi:hypothetical protein